MHNHIEIHVARAYLMHEKEGRLTHR